jgi:hypothetical protein
MPPRLAALHALPADLVEWMSGDEIGQLDINTEFLGLRAD